MGTTQQQQPPQKEYEPTQSLTLELRTPSDLDSELRPIFIAGNFNNWKTEDDRFKMRKISTGRFIFCFPNTVTLPQPLEYKYIRGDWEHQELDDFGEMVPNRVLAFPYDASFVQDTVPRWMNYGLTFAPKFLPKKQIVSESFFMPNLGRYRRVSILLPYDYHQKSDKRYPVLYLNDGQNLMDPRSPYGNWAVDQKMALLAERGKGDLILVTIDHAGADRLHEYIPTDEQGKKYMLFLIEVLKPYIDKVFKTKPESAFTGIGGASLGGLISLYAGLKYPSIFGRLLVFSPSLWVLGGAKVDFSPFEDAYPTHIYMYAGGQEGASMVPNARRVKKQLESHNAQHKRFEINLSIDPKGQHTEARWGREFIKAIEWLF
jgi:predicted alpha/beta superfamily hydrolase